MVDISSTENKKVTADELSAECHRLRYLELLEKAEVFPSEANWEFIISNKMEGIGKLLLRKYLVSWLMPEDKRSIYHTQALRFFPEYIQAVSRPYALEVAYSDIDSAPRAFVALVRNTRLFDAKYLMSLIDDRGAVELVVELIDVYQPDYTREDARNMRLLLNKLLSLPKLGRVEQRHGIFSSDVRYYCPAGHSNPATETFCTHDDCRMNICGLTPEQVKKIDEFETRIKALEGLLNNR